MFLRDMAEMLDNVLQFFIDNAPDAVSRAKFSAQRERSDRHWCPRVPRIPAEEESAMGVCDGEGDQ